MQDVANPASATGALNGTCDPRFEAIRKAFERHFTEYDELGASVAVTLGGELVVDLWGGWKDKARTRPWTRETRAPLWSGTKAIAGISFAMIVERGLCRYEDRVSDYWPAFAAQGKGEVTIAQVLAHQAGFTGFLSPMSYEDLLSNEIAGARLAAQKPLWPPGAAFGYNGVAVGSMVAPLFQAIEGRTVRAFVAEEIARPFGLAVSIGVDPEDFEETAEAVRAEKGMDLKRFFGVTSQVPLGASDNPDLNAAQAAALNPPIDALYANRADWRAADLPGLNGFGNARSMAQLYALVLGHKLDGVRLAAPEALAEATRVRAAGVDAVKKVPARWGAGFSVNESGLYGPNSDTFFHAGMGGHFTLGDPVADMTISYTPNRMDELFELDPRRRGLVKAVYECM